MKPLSFREVANSGCRRIACAGCGALAIRRSAPGAFEWVNAADSGGHSRLCGSSKANLWVVMDTLPPGMYS